MYVSDVFEHLTKLILNQDRGNMYNISMINYFQALILGALQGVSELFPISSLGHSVIFPTLFGWHLNQQAPFFLTFIVATHFATAVVLFLFFFKDWIRILSGILRSLKAREISPQDSDARLGWLLVVGTIPAGVLGLLFEDSLKKFFASPHMAAGFLFCNGIMLFAAEFLRRKSIQQAQADRNSDIRIAKLHWIQSIIVGAAQAIALFPGFSRTGATLSGGLLVGLSHEDAARYSFLLATPIILAAAVLKIPELFTTSEHAILGQAFVGACAAGVCAYFSVKFLLKYFKTQTLIPFGVYCLLVGGGVFLLTR